LGLYAFRQKTLQEISQANPVPLEEQEALEQLRWLYLGYDIKVVVVQEAAIGIDTPEDLKKINLSMYE
jgi:3-deoxy-manno-octulosonate cytidylyltransferase (CMP-KDO synthetase)